jgi:hypothetical protein
MSKELLIDHIPFNIAKVTLLSESKIAGGRMRIKGKIQEAEQKNGNGRVYPKEILQREIDNYIKEQVNSNTSMGELDHPDSSIVNLNNVAHIIKKIWWEGNDVMAELELLNTPSGKIAQELIMANIPLGISSRGMGSIRQIGETVEVQDDFSLLCFDLVSVPSTPKAYLTLAEGKQYNSIKDYTKVNSLITEIICTTTGTCALC